MINLVFKILFNVIFNRLERVVLMEELIKKVEEWSKERNLDTADPNKQRLKLWEEFGELNAAIARDNYEDAIDAIGDMAVVMIIYCQQQGYHFEDHYELYGYTTARGIEELMDDIAYAIIKLNLTAYLSEVSRYLDMLAHVYYGTTLKSCLQSAYDEIKDRRGKMINGVFVKESDLKN